MPQKKHKPDEIDVRLRLVDVFLSLCQSVAEPVRSIALTQSTYYRWRKIDRQLERSSSGRNRHPVQLPRPRRP